MSFLVSKEEIRRGIDKEYEKTECKNIPDIMRKLKIQNISRFLKPLYATLQNGGYKQLPYEYEMNLFLSYIIGENVVTRFFNAKDDNGLIRMELVRREKRIDQALFETKRIVWQDERIRIAISPEADTDLGVYDNPEEMSEEETVGEFNSLLKQITEDVALLNSFSERLRLPHMYRFYMII